MEHVHAEILRGMADGLPVLVKAPYDEEFVPLGDASSTAKHALFSPGSIVNPGTWEFKLGGDESSDSMGRSGSDNGRLSTDLSRVDELESEVSRLRGELNAAYAEMRTMEPI